jgi:hypothetical protein
MPKIVCEFSGYFAVDADKVRFLNTETDEVKTAAQWLKKRGNIDGLVLQSFTKAYVAAHDVEFEQLDFEIAE